MNKKQTTAFPPQYFVIDSLQKIMNFYVEFSHKNRKMCIRIDLNMSVAYFTATLLVAACLTQRAVQPLTREESR